MFTGIIKGVGEVKAYNHASFVLNIKSALFTERQNLLGASIAINGVCLTASHLEAKDEGILGFDLGLETRKVTLLTKLSEGTLVNIEFGLLASEPLDGHMVQGHVDALAKIETIETLTDGILVGLNAPHDVMNYIVKKGSIALNGVSLTINEVTKDRFFVFIVPYTKEHTTFKSSKIGDLVHVETDIFGRYIHHFFKRRLLEDFSDYEHHAPSFS